MQLLLEAAEDTFALQVLALTQEKGIQAGHVSTSSAATGIAGFRLNHQLPIAFCISQNLLFPCFEKVWHQEIYKTLTFSERPALAIEMMDFFPKRLWIRRPGMRKRKWSIDRRESSVLHIQEIGQAAERVTAARELLHPDQLMGLRQPARRSKMAGNGLRQRHGHSLPHRPGRNTRAPCKHRDPLGSLLSHRAVRNMRRHNLDMGQRDDPGRPGEAGIYLCIGLSPPPILSPHFVSNLPVAVN